MLPFLVLLGPAAALYVLPPEQAHLSTKSCKEDIEYKCQSGKCIPNAWVCDGESDCDDGGEEKSCKETICAYNQFQCELGSCIPDSWVCDGQVDCANGADEANCSKTCGPDQFACKDSDWCIQKLWVCDGDDDCSDRSDEINCPNIKCRANEFTCDEKNCISEKWRCDGDIDCKDGSDEEGCATEVSKSNICRSTEYRCNDMLTCIPLTWLCDGDDDCPNKDDENTNECNKTITCRPDQVRCQDTCISGLSNCNGVKDCADNSDEKNCSVVSVRACKDGEFDCGENTCIPGAKACDGHMDCPNGEDEPVGKCHINECQLNNGGCSHQCIDKPIGYVCACKPGYKLTSEKNCEDINECDNPGVCSHTCINEVGSFKCECFEGYKKDPYDRTWCKPIDGHTSLLFTRKHDIRRLSFDHHEMSSLINNTKSAAALDYLYKSGMIFWSDLSEHKIYKAPIEEDIRSAVLSNEMITCDGLAIDWIYDHIYWTDSEKNSIEVAKLDGTMKKTLFGDGLDEPRAIAVNPLDGWMYWSDWGGEAHIEKGGLDGSHRQVIVSFDIKWPNGLALDFVRQRLYWVDAKLNTISSVNYDGSDRLTIIKSAQVLHHPFSISVFEDFIYWTDWEKQGIFRANKFTGENITDLTSGRKVQNLMVVHAYHPYKQPNGTNHCLINQCSHFCLPAPQISSSSPKISCACPDELVLSPDELHCIEKVSSTQLPEVSVNTLKTAEASAHTGSISRGAAIPIVIISILLFVVFMAMVTYIVYRNYIQKNTSSINFDNPVYRKTTEDKFSLVKAYPQSCDKRDASDDMQEPLCPD